MEVRLVDAVRRPVAMDQKGVSGVWKRLTGSPTPVQLVNVADLQSKAVCFGCLTVLLR